MVDAVARVLKLPPANFEPEPGFLVRVLKLTGFLWATENQSSLTYTLQAVLTKISDYD